MGKQTEILLFYLYFRRNYPIILNWWIYQNYAHASLCYARFIEINRAKYAFIDTFNDRRGQKKNRKARLKSYIMYRNFTIIYVPYL